MSPKLNQAFLNATENARNTLPRIYSKTSFVFVTVHHEIERIDLKSKIEHQINKRMELFFLQIFILVSECLLVPSTVLWTFLFNLNYEKNKCFFCVIQDTNLNNMSSFNFAMHQCFKSSFNNVDLIQVSSFNNVDQLGQLYCWQFIINTALGFGILLTFSVSNFLRLISRATFLFQFVCFPLCCSFCLSASSHLIMKSRNHSNQFCTLRILSISEF